MITSVVDLNAYDAEWKRVNFVDEDAEVRRDEPIVVMDNDKGVIVCETVLVIDDGVAVKNLRIYRHDITINNLNDLHEALEALQS